MNNVTHNNTQPTGKPKLDFSKLEEFLQRDIYPKDLAEVLNEGIIKDLCRVVQLKELSQTEGDLYTDGVLNVTFYLLELRDIFREMEKE